MVDRYERSGEENSNVVVVKVGLIGDSGVGKTSLMVKYVEGKFDEDYITTLGVNFMEKMIRIQNNEIKFSLWDLGGQKQFEDMLPLVCNDAIAILFIFDLTNPDSLKNIRSWYSRSKKINRGAHSFLIGTKFDKFNEKSYEYKELITKQSFKYANAMKAPLIFSSSSVPINVSKIFKVVLANVFDLKTLIQEKTTVGEPIVQFYTKAQE